jgi:hypothetical protein
MEGVDDIIGGCSSGKSGDCFDCALFIESVLDCTILSNVCQPSRRMAISDTASRTRRLVRETVDIGDRGRKFDFFEVLRHLGVFATSATCDAHGTVRMLV